MITRGFVGALGFGQLALWGVSDDLTGVFGPRIADDLGWSQTLVATISAAPCRRFPARP